MRCPHEEYNTHRNLCRKVGVIYNCIPIQLPVLETINLGTFIFLICSLILLIKLNEYV